MKWFSLLASLFFYLPVLASSSFLLNHVTVECQGSELCRQREARFDHLKGEYRSQLHLKNTLKVVASDGGYQSFSYQLFEKDNQHFLMIKIKLKPTIEEIQLVFSDRKLDVTAGQLMSLSEGSFYEPLRVKDSGELLRRRLENMGYPNSSHKYEVTEKAGKVKIKFTVTLGSPRLYKQLRSNSKSVYVTDFLNKKFVAFYNKPFEFSKFKQTLDEAQRELFSYGYYLISLDMAPLISGDRVTVEIKVSNDQLFSFDFQNIHREERENLLLVVKDLFRRYKRPLPVNTLRLALKEHYEKLALLNTFIDIKISKFPNKFGEAVTHYRINVKEGDKTRMRNIAFSGNIFFTEAQLQKMFDKEAFELASIQYYDKEYLEFFVNHLKTEYIQSGFVQVRVLEPIHSFDEARRESKVEFHIQEGPRTFVRSIKIEGLPEDFHSKILSSISNKKGEAINPITLAEDIKKVAIILQEHGYYFAEVVTANDEDFAHYNSTGTEVDIRMKVELGPLIRLNRVLIIGNNKTQKKVIEKKVRIKPDQVITPSKTREIESSLSATGLFTTVNVTPLKHASKDSTTDLIIKVSERDYGLIEFAPGYRSDLGIKLTGTASYLNIGGKNQALTLKGQVNQRLNRQTLHPERRQVELNFVEYNTSINFTQGDIFESLIDYGAGLSFQRRRFFPFDADIIRMNNTFTRDINKQLSTSLRYQYETITQWNAVEARDQGSFRIGSITPVITWDLRNSQVLPTSGAFYNLSCEIANPYLLSQQNDELTVHYYKFISRNRFYLPYSNGTLAISAVAGVQENLARDPVLDNTGNPEILDGRERTSGYIPNIKVFRLTGMDIVRGYDDTEINLQPDGRDISAVRIQNRAFIANFKVEPRYFINDNLMGGVFLDAGRVFVDRVNPWELRTSAGLTFKILTPVGTLDFDYGIKLLRKRLPDGRLEDPGRFHVSIGFF